MLDYPRCSRAQAMRPYRLAWGEAGGPEQQPHPTAYWELLGLANSDPEFRDRVLAQIDEAIP